MQDFQPFPDGLLGDVARFIYEQAPYPNPDIALAGAIGFLAGIAGREYNVCGLGLNQYILVLSPTGTGKEAIASGMSKLFAAVAATVPAIMDRSGPGYIQSGPGLIKALAKSPCFVCVIGEVGLRLPVIASPRANANDKLALAVLLDCYAKSGHGHILGAMAYSDREKNIPAIDSPALTIVGEGVPESFYSAIDESHIASGLLPRFLAFENRKPRPYLNRDPVSIPNLAMVQILADISASCLAAANARRLVGEVGFSAGAAAIFARFEPWVTDQVNAAGGEVARQLWNRTYVKALKLAALSAVGRNYLAPVISEQEAMWATTLVVDQTNAMLGRFASGEVGEEAGNETKQINEVVRVIGQYLAAEYQRYEKFGGSFEMHRDGVITEAHISRRLGRLPAFAKDRVGATGALKRTIKALLEADDLREIPAAQMLQKYGCKPRAFVASNPHRFVGIS